MERYRKKDMLQTVDTLLRANDAIIKTVRSNPQGAAEALAQCQESAIALGTYIDTLDEKYEELVHILEDYCENVYQMSESLSDENLCRKVSKKIQKQLTGLQNSIKYDLPEDRKEAVFLPYKASMWDSLESVWKAADADSGCDAYVIPIPYFDKNPDGSFKEEHYEGDQYPDYVPITRYDEYDLEARRPDVIYIHNPYDECNHVTSVHPYFYSKNLRNFTDKLVYIPYFILGEIDPGDQAAIDGMKHFCFTPGTIFADQVIVQSENMRQIYINEYIKAAKEMGLPGEHVDRKFLEKKFLGTGSPKIDKVLNTKKEDLEIPAEWLRIIEKPDGSWKRVVFYNTGVATLLQHDKRWLDKIEDVLDIFKNNKDKVTLLWRPHPLIENTLASMRPEMLLRYQQIKRDYIDENWGIYDDTADVNRAIVLSDAFYGDTSSIVSLYKGMGKPVMLQNPRWIDQRQNEKYMLGSYESVIWNDFLYLTSEYTNLLLEIDLKHDYAVGAYYFPNEKKVWKLYQSFVLIGDEIWFAPFNAREAYIFNCVDKSFEIVDIGLSDKEKRLTQKFVAILYERGNAYYLGETISGIVKVNVQSRESERLSQYGDLIRASCGGESTRFVLQTGESVEVSKLLFSGKYAIDENNIYFTMRFCNFVLSVNIDSNEFRIIPYDNGMKNEGGCEIWVNDDVITVAGRGASFVDLSLKEGGQNRYILNVGDETELWYGDKYVLEVKGKKYFFSGVANTIYKYDGNTVNKIYFNVTEDFWSKEGTYMAWEFAVSYGDDIYFQTCAGAKLYCLDTNDDSIKEILVPIPEKLYKEICQETLRESKESADIISETGYIGLFSLLDFLKVDSTDL